MLVIGTPCFGGMVTVPYMLAMMGVKDVLNRAKTPFRLLTPCHESLITRARNSIANAVLRDETATHLLFIDADIAFEPLLVPHLLGSGKDVVCGWRDIGGKVHVSVAGKLTHVGSRAYSGDFSAYLARHGARRNG